MIEKLEFKYKPKTFAEMIAEPDIKVKLQKAIKEVPNMLLCGPPGVGKGTFVDILIAETKMDVLKINCSDETGIDTIRDKVKTFATAVGMGGLKIVYLNECDYLSQNAQAMLRDLMETVQHVTRFVLCCNYSHKVLPELMSRCEMYELGNPPAIDVVKHCWSILDREGVKYDKAVVVELVKSIWKKQPDIRKTLITLRQNIVDGVLLSEIKVSSADDIYSQILEGMKSGDPDAVRKLLKSHQIDYAGMYKYLYDSLMGDEDVFKMDAQAIIHVGEHSYRDNAVAIREINFMHMFFKMLSDGTI